MSVITLMLMQGKQELITYDVLQKNLSCLMEFTFLSFPYKEVILFYSNPYFQADLISLMNRGDEIDFTQTKVLFICFVHYLSVKGLFVVINYFTHQIITLNYTEIKVFILNSLCIFPTSSFHDRFMNLNLLKLFKLNAFWMECSK
jgi:hypothetical protein